MLYRICSIFSIIVLTIMPIQSHAQSIDATIGSTDFLSILGIETVPVCAIVPPTLPPLAVPQGTQSVPEGCTATLSQATRNDLSSLLNPPTLLLPPPPKRPRLPNEEDNPGFAVSLNPASMPRDNNVCLGFIIKSNSL